jgi:hypothetical protein
MGVMERAGGVKETVGKCGISRCAIRAGAPR